MKATIVGVLLVAVISGCAASADDNKSPTTTTSRRSALTERYLQGFRNAYIGYSQSQREDFCWMVYDSGMSTAGRNAFEYERSIGGSVQEAQAAEAAMRSFIREVC